MSSLSVATCLGVMIIIVVLVTKLCLTLCHPMDCSPPGSSGISQARILEQVAISFSRGSFRPRDQTHVSCTGRRLLYHWASRGTLWSLYTMLLTHLWDMYLRYVFLRYVFFEIWSLRYVFQKKAFISIVSSTFISGLSLWKQRKSSAKEFKEDFFCCIRILDLLA